MTVGEMLQRMSAEEFTEWQIMDRTFDPFGSWRDDYRAGTMMVPVVNLLRSKWVESPVMSTPSDWSLEKLLLPTKPVKPQTTKEMMLIAKAMADGERIREERKKGTWKSPLSAN